MESNKRAWLGGYNVYNGLNTSLYCYPLGITLMRTNHPRSYNMQYTSSKCSTIELSHQLIGSKVGWHHCQSESKHLK